MVRWMALLALLAACCAVGGPVPAEELVVFTAHQNMDSRIYVLRPDGSVRDLYEAFTFYAADVEVVPDPAPLRQLVVAPLGLPAGTKRLLISPDGLLAYVPFALLTKACR